MTRTWTPGLKNDGLSFERVQVHSPLDVDDDDLLEQQPTHEWKQDSSREAVSQ